MRIGSFAKLCKTQISVLRHYDKIGLITPAFIDKFTGYRYYDSAQVTDFEQILRLKKLGFSLKEIKKLRKLNDSKEYEKGFDNKIVELELLITQIKQVKKGDFIMNKSILKKEKIEEIDIKAIEFENDPNAVGKWAIIGEYDKKDDFLSEIKPIDGMYGEKFKEIYFLPNGQRYWVYSWTNGYIINSNGDYTAVNPYTIEEINGEKYMFVEWKSYYYMMRGGEKTVLVLKKSDNKKYTLAEISKTDDIDKPFIDDKKILGKWKSVAYVHDINDEINFDYPEDNLFFKQIEFKENGCCEKVYKDKKVTQSYGAWTKGYLLNKSGGGIENTAEKYDIKIINGKEYLFIEWKSGDYIWGGWESSYYVFVRE